MSLWDWLRKLRPPAPECSWSVEVAADVIRTSDGLGTTRELPIADLNSVVVATDDSGPWGYDVVFLLYGNAAEAVSIFPLEAGGCQKFVGWLSNLPGYRDRHLAKAMGSTDVARFVVYQRID